MVIEEWRSRNGRDWYQTALWRQFVGRIVEKCLVVTSW